VVGIVGQWIGKKGVRWGWDEMGGDLERERIR
jgi:hypothetical protein